MSHWKYFLVACALIVTSGTANATTYSFSGVFTSGPVSGCCSTAPPAPAVDDTLSGTLTYVGSPSQPGSITGQTAVTGNPALTFTSISSVFYGDGYDIVIAPSTTGGYWLTVEYGVWCFYCAEGPTPTALIYGGLSATVSTGDAPTIAYGDGGVVGTYGPIVETGFNGAQVVPTTPIPAALPLFAGGLGLIGFFSQRKRRLS